MVDVNPRDHENVDAANGAGAVPGRLQSALIGSVGLMLLISDCCRGGGVRKRAAVRDRRAPDALPRSAAEAEAEDDEPDVARSETSRWCARLRCLSRRRGT